MDHDNACEGLLGLTLDTGWEVIEKLEKQKEDTGGFFSVCYKVKKDGKICFLKAFNFAKFLQISEGSGQSVQVVDVMSEMLNAFRYERDLSSYCKDKYVTKVVFVKDSGEQYVSGYSIPVVPYLIFELANGNVRSILKYTDKLDNAWKLNSLHSVAVGMRQLHAIDVSHQDIKPSNVLIFNEESKIGDLGRSICSSLNSPYINLAFAGDHNYAPPEILYKYYEKEWRTRSFAADYYLFGSLIVFYFAGTTMNALLRMNIPDELSWEYYRGSFNDVKAYILEAFSKAIEKFESCVTNDFLRKELRRMVEYLCFPLPEKRGHPRILGNRAMQYDFERVITELDVLHRKVKYQLFDRV